MRRIKDLVSIVVVMLVFAGSAFAIVDVPAPNVQKGYPVKYTQDYIKQITPIYKSTGKEEVIYVALDMLKGTSGEFSRNALLGQNLSQRPVKIEFKDLGSINQAYASFDALGWKKGEQLFVFINPRHKDAPPGALAALLAHEAIHQDEYNSLTEETYAWTLEAAVWTEIVAAHPYSNDELHPLVNRMNTLKKLFERGDYTNRYIKKTVYTNEGYKNLPATSPGFEDL